jgi:hypothetical protein
MISNLIRIKLSSLYHAKWPEYNFHLLTSVYLNDGTIRTTMSYELHFYSSILHQLTYMHLHQPVIRLIPLGPYQKCPPLLHDFRT